MHDHHTSTVEAAAAFDAVRAGGLVDDDRPSASDLAEDAQVEAAWRKIEERREAAAQARGEYVPNAHQKHAAALITFLMIGTQQVEATPVRENIFRIDALHPIDVGALARTLGTNYEVREHGGEVWAKWLRPESELDNPPF